MAGEKSRILIVGATGYLGTFMVKASISMGHPTYAYVRPLINSSSAHPSKQHLHEDFQSMGVTIFQGELDDHDKLVSALKQVEVVISTLAAPQHLEQLKIIRAMQEAGNIKRFVPSEFGNEVDRASALPPFEALMEIKRRIRRATEAAGLSYTYVAANSFAAYFVSYLLHPHDQKTQSLTVYGSGEAKVVVMNYEEDVAAYTVRAATDPRAANRVLICRPPGNIVSQLELISAWEKKTGRIFEKIHIPEEEMITLSDTLPYPENIAVAILHNMFIKGDQMSFDLTEQDLEASKLYPDHQCTSIDSLLESCLVEPPTPKLAAFA